MFGKFFASTFTGSMMGAGADVFAVWSYVIAHAVDGTVELNPRLLAAVIGMSEEKVSAALGILAAPDARSRSKVENGRRLIKVGEFSYSVPTHAFYRAIRSEDDRREYNRTKQAESRARRRAVKTPVNDGQSQLPMSAHTEAEIRARDQSQSQREEQKGARTAPVSGYPAEFEEEWAMTAKIGSKDKAHAAWKKLGKPAFGPAWKRWAASPEWQQDWYHPPHVVTWLNDGRWKQEPAAAIKAGTAPALPFAVRAEREREERILEEQADRIFGGGR